MTVINWLLSHFVWALFFLSVFVILFVGGLVLAGLVRKKMKELANQLHTDLKTAMFVWIILSNFPIHQLIRGLKILKRVVIIGHFPLVKKKILIVSNHPGWLDQATIIQFFLSYLEWLKDPNVFPYIGTARDSIIRLPFLQFLEISYVLTPIERQKLDEAAEVEENLIRILNNGNNLIISGPAGRDFRKKAGEAIYSPLKKKPLRKFGGLCGRLSTLDGVITVPVYIEGSDKLFQPIDNGRKARFSWYNFLIRFLLLGKIKISIVISETPLILARSTKGEARKKIEGAVLNLADTC